ncbi:hypothetical protein [Nitrosopumilus sp.]|uniref:hypothetical protein n=1 Tax=Nitrosopumilus sp. TaxID=2024843 RepID=UPI00292F0A05|nr:hypothetical protein [Nitrosopumilus sp.]
MNFKIRNFVVVIVVIAVSGFIAYESGVFAPTIVQGQGQINPMTFEQKIETYDMIVIGTVQSVETKTVDESWTSRPALFDEEGNHIGEGEPTYIEKHVPYQHITLRVDEYLKDATGEYSDTITVLDHDDGLGTSDGIKHQFKYDLKTDYEVGDKSLYFIWQHSETKNLHTTGHLSKYNIGKDNMIQREFSDRALITLSSRTNVEIDTERYIKERHSPISLDEARKKIPLILERQSEIDKYLDTPASEKTLKNISKDLRNEGITFAKYDTVKVVTKNLLESQYDSGEILSIDSKEVKDILKEAKKQSEDREKGIPSSETSQRMTEDNEQAGN